MDNLLNKIKTCYVNDDGEKWTHTEELLAEHCETLQAELASLRAERDALREALEYISDHTADDLTVKDGGNWVDLDIYISRVLATAQQEEAESA